MDRPRTTRLSLRDNLEVEDSSNWACPAMAISSDMVDMLERGPSWLDKLENGM